MRTHLLLTLLACREPPDRRDGPRAEDPPGPAPVWRDRAVSGNVLARSFDRGRDLPGEVTCTSLTDPSEVHTGGSDGEIVLYGLLADTKYGCELVAGGVTEQRTFSTGSLPDWLPTWTMAVEGDAGGDYTLLNHGTDRRGDRQPKLLIVDPEGRLRWYASIPQDASDLDASWLGDGRILFGGGYAVPPTVIDLSGRTLLVAPALEAPNRYHHDTEQLATGEFLGVSESPDTDGTNSWRGARIDVFDPGLVASSWSWTTQRGVDEGWLPSPGRDGGDPFHLNSVEVVDDQLYVNFRPLHMLARIDRPTGDLVWRLGADGDFLLVDETGAPADPADWFDGPHAPEPDGDHFLFYDNGGNPGPRKSRALEMVIDEVAMTARITWEFTEDGWFESIWGDVDRLPDGHVLITRAHCQVCRPGSDDFTQIVEVDPATNEVVWRLVMDAQDDGGYRAERIDGCAIFANRRYCP